MQRRAIILLTPITLATIVAAVIAQRPPAPRLHDVIKKGILNRIPSNQEPAVGNEVTITTNGQFRVIRSNGIPNHNTGQFPNRGNPNRITSQNHEYKIPASPQIADKVTPMFGEFGVAINGVPFDPGAGEFYDGEPGWQYEPLSGAIALGIDMSHAHVQPNGKYHYHGLPTGLLDSVEMDHRKHSPLIGWAADGFPIYAVYGYSDPDDPKSPIQKLTSSYQLKEGNRPGGDAPSGTYDGTFVRDYEYVRGSGDLDECNGRMTTTPEFPEGTYAYFLTEQWPVVPRFWKGTPSADFQHGPNGRPTGSIAGTPSRAGGGSNRPRMREQGRPDTRQSNAPSGPGQILPFFVREPLNLTKEQSEKIDELQELVDKRLKEILSENQLQTLQNPRPRGPRGFGPGDFSPPGRQNGFRPGGF